MCGIAGIASLDGLRPDDERLVNAMLATLAHRGPDEQRVFTDDRTSFGARRLSIIDLDTGSQPLGNEDGSIQVTQNGEIYNYVELRDELLARGHTLRTHGDTETIALLYEDFGDRFVEHLRGMFAIAIWDARRKRLVLARDRLGKKPIYWTIRDGRLAWGSELKALLADPSQPRELDRVALARFLQYQYIPAPGTILHGVHKLEPASVLTWDGGDVEIRRYWSPTYGPKANRSLDEDREEGLELLREAVRLRLRSDVPVGLFLSGGMDSSTVLALMAEASSQPVRTFTIGFEDAEYDERNYARAVATHFGTQHTEEVVALDVIGMLPGLAEHYDEPFGDSSAIPTYRVAQVAAPHVRVVLTGDGGDETFAGYDRYRVLLALNRLAVLPKPMRKGLVHARDAARRMSGRAVVRSDSNTSLAETVVLSADEQYLRGLSQSDLRLRSRLMGGDPVADQDAYLLDALASGPTDLLDRMLHADTLTYLPEDLLVKMDRATMAHSLEARAPLLDHKLVEFTGRLPAQRKMQAGTTKVLLREIAGTLLPPSLLDRPKYGFAAPLEGWFREDLAGVYRDVVLAPDARLRDHLDQEVAAGMLTEHLGGRADLSRRMWLLLAFELWARRWLEVGVRA
jgi:asparagine synthase (glutamine-hydrolysing)